MLAVRNDSELNEMFGKYIIAFAGVSLFFVAVFFTDRAFVLYLNQSLLLGLSDNLSLLPNKSQISS